MVKKRAFPPEPPTRPDIARSRQKADQVSGPVPKGARDRSVISTMPPPPTEPPATESLRPRTKVSKVRPKKRPLSAATVDEVTADLSKDPRTEDDGDDDGSEEDDR